MVKKVKGLKVQNKLTDKFKFDREGNSQIGSSPTDSHAVSGTMNTGPGELTLTGDLVLDRRLQDALFGVPQLDGATQTSEIQDLLTNIANYEGFIVYLTSSSSLEPFVVPEKFYFCENGEWHPSPFVTKDTATYDTDGDGVVDDLDAFPYDPNETTDTDGDGVGDNADAFPNDPYLKFTAHRMHRFYFWGMPTTGDVATKELTSADGWLQNSKYSKMRADSDPSLTGYPVGDGTYAYTQTYTGEAHNGDINYAYTEWDTQPDGNVYTMNIDLPADYTAGYGINMIIGNADISSDPVGIFQFANGARTDANPDGYVYFRPYPPMVDELDSNGDPTGLKTWAEGGRLKIQLKHDTDNKVYVRIAHGADEASIDIDSVAWVEEDVIDADHDRRPTGYDLFPNDPNNTYDQDQDGLGTGAETAQGTSDTNPDTDGDGVDDATDAFPADASETTDTDGDGVGDNSDAFPNDPTESADVNYNTLGDSGDITAMNATGSTTMAISFDHATPDAMNASYSTYGYGWNYKTVRTLGTVESINGTSFQEQVTHAGYGNGGSYRIYVDFSPDQRLNHPIADVSISNAEVSGNLMPVFVISENYRNDESSYYNSSTNYYPDMYVDWGKGRFLLEHDKSEQQEVKNFKFERDPTTGLMKVWWGYTDVATLEANDTWTLYFDEATDPDTVYTAAYNNQDTNLNTINDWLDFDAINTVSSSAISLSFNHLDSNHKETSAYNNLKSVYTLGTLESMNNDYFPRRFLQQEDHAGYGQGGDEYLYWYDIDQHFDNNNKANSHIANVSLSHAEVSGSSMPVYVMSYLHNPLDATMDDFKAPHLLADFGLGRVNLSHSVTEATAQGVDYKTFKFERDPSTTNWKIWYGYGTASEVETANSWVLYLDQANSIWPDTPPELDLNGFDAHVVPLDAQGTYIDPGYTALDIVDGDITSYVTASGNVDLTTEGTYQISYEVTDSRGNTSSRTRDVTVATSSAPAGFPYEGLIYHQVQNPQGILDSYIYTDLEVYDLSTGYSGSALQFADYHYQYSDFQFEEGKTYGIKYTDEHSDGDVEFVFTENHNNTRQALAPDTTSSDMLNIPFKYTRFTWPFLAGNANVDMTTHWFKLLWMDKTLYINDQAVMFYDSNDGLWKGSQDTDGSYLNDSFEHFSSVTIDGEKCVFPTGMTEPQSPVQSWNGFFSRSNYGSAPLGDARIRVSDIESAEYGSSTSYGDQYGHFETEVQPNGDINMTLK